MTPLERLLGDVVMPSSPAGADYRDASDARCGAISEAEKRDPDRFFDVLAEEPTLLQDHDVAWIVSCSTHDRAIDPLLAILGNPKASWRDIAAGGLVSRRDARLIDPLIAALRDRAPSVREPAIRALGKQRSASRAIAPLREALARKSNAKDPRIVELIGEAIKRLSK